MVSYPAKPVPRGHQAYLSSAPHYDFPRYRQLVHEITLTFSGISREVLRITGRLRDELARPDLAQHLTRLQEREQEKLQLVSTGLWGENPKAAFWGGGSHPLPCPPRRQRSSSWPGSGRRMNPTWTPISRRCGSSSTSRWWPCCGLPLNFGMVASPPLPGWEPLPRLSPPSIPGGPQMVPSNALFGCGPGEGLAMPRGRGPLGLPGLSVS